MEETIPTPTPQTEVYEMPEPLPLFPLDRHATFVSPTRSSKCPFCSKRFTKTFSETDGATVWFCGNKFCGNAGFGYKQSAKTGLVIDGYFHAELYQLRKMQY